MIHLDHDAMALDGHVVADIPCGDSMAGGSPDKLAKVCLDLGDTIVDPATWPRVMERICQAADIAGAVLLQTDVRTPDVPRTESFDEMLRFYFAGGWQTRDIRAERAVPLLLKGKKAFIDEDILTRQELESAQLLHECTLPKGFKWAAGVGFSAGGAMWALCLHRTVSQEPFDSFDARLLETLSDRLTEVATLSTAVGRVALASATNALNLVRQPAVAIDRRGFVVDANAATDAIFDAGIHLKNRRLFVADRQAKGCLDRLVDQLRITADTATLPCEPIVIRRDGKGPVIIRVLPVHGAARTPFLGARALLTFSSIETKPAAASPSLLAKAFGLTPAECRLAALMAQGLSPEQAAKQLGIARVTARNQLRAVFAKTGTHRQSELVALLVRL
jgi:DNA-binding CsgD family transcriptional regulator